MIFWQLARAAMLFTTFHAMVPQLDKCLKFKTFWGVILCRVQSFSSPRIDLNFRHLSSCDTKAQEDH